MGNGCLTMSQGTDIVGAYKAEEFREMHLLVKSGTWVLELILAGQYIRFYSMDTENAKKELTQWGGVIAQHKQRYAKETIRSASSAQERPTYMERLAQRAAQGDRRITEQDL